MTDDLINDCKTIGTVNQELIARIRTIGDETTQFKNYYVQKRDEVNEQGFFFVEEVIEDLPRSSILENWKKAITLKKPVDLFNDKLNFICTTFEDICRLNEGMLGVVDKFLFLDPKRAKSELEKFKANFEILQQSLGEVEGTFHNVSDFSKLQSYQNELNDINQRIGHLVLNPDVIFGAKFGWETNVTSHTVNKNRATLISGQRGCLLVTRGYSTGIHRYTINVITRTSTCMVGVAPNTVSRSSYNYNSTGFFLNFNDGTLYSGPPYSYSCRTLIGRGINGGSVVIVILNCDKHTLTYSVDGQEFLAYENLPNNKYFLAFDNDTSAGSEIELTKVQHTSS